MKKPEMSHLTEVILSPVKKTSVRNSDAPPTEIERLRAEVLNLYAFYDPCPVCRTERILQPERVNPDASEKELMGLLNCDECNSYFELRIVYAGAGHKLTRVKSPHSR
jgi:hypothetical protein